MINIDVVNVYTDGSLQRKKHDIICGYGIHYDTPLLEDVSAPFIDGKLTNNRAELYAIFIAIKTIVDKCFFKKINIYTDSEYSQKSLTIWLNTWKKNGWLSSQKNPVENQDLIKSIDIYLQKYPQQIFIHWIRSHTNNQDTHSICNNIADRLARANSS